MSKQSREKKAAIYNDSLRKRSRSICHIFAFVLYIVFMISTYGSGYMFFFFGTIATILFIIVFAVVYYPARACVERFLNTRLTKKKRYVFLLLVLIPYILGIAFFAYIGLDYHFTSREYVAKQAEKEMIYFQQAYNQNSSLLNYINDNILTEASSEEVWRIRSLRYNADTEELYLNTYNNSENIGLESFEHLTLEDKESIQRIMLNMSMGRYNIDFAHDYFQIRYSNDVGVHIYKRIISGRYEPLLSQVRLDENWLIGIHVAQRPM